MKRKQLQALCKKHKVPANLPNFDMANKLTELLKVILIFYVNWKRSRGVCGRVWFLSSWGSNLFIFLEKLLLKFRIRRLQ